MFNTNPPTPLASSVWDHWTAGYECKGKQSSTWYHHILLACLSQVSLKEGPHFPPRTQSGSLRPPYLRLGSVPVPPAPSLGSWKSMDIHENQ